jgi:hypothetical protein
MSSPPRNLWLIVGAVGSLGVAALHAVIIFVGAPGYRYFGAPDLAVLVERGSAIPALLTTGIVLLFAAWAAYAFSGAGILRPVPLLRTGLVLIAFVYMLRGLLLEPELVGLTRGTLRAARAAAFSAVSLGLGLVHVAGLAAHQRQRRSQGPGAA